MNHRPLLHNFKVLLPRYHGSQEYTFTWLAAAHARAEATASSNPAAEQEWLPRLQRLVKRYGCSPQHIGQRRTELKDFLHNDWERMQIFNLHENAEGRGIAERSRFYAEIAQRAAEDFYAAEEQPPSDLLHVTCTGYVSPSAVQRLITQKGWQACTRATQVYHMGCFAAVPAVRLAAGLLLTPQSGAAPRADIIHTELCTLHFNPHDHAPEQLVVQSLFADGHICYSLSPRDANIQQPALEVLAVREEAVPASLDDMTWVLSDYGFRMTLSRDVPAKIAASLPGFLTRLYADGGVDFAAERAATSFAIHPGGPRIIDSVRELLELTETQIAQSRAVLHERGNMSSATLPHIWLKISEAAEVKSGTLIASLAFGPGLTIAGTLFRKC